MADFHEEREYRWKREPQRRRPEQRDQEEWEDLRVPRGRSRSDYSRERENNNPARARIHEAVGKLINGDASAEQMLKQVSSHSQQEAADLALVLDRLHDGMKREFNGEIQSKLPHVQQLLFRLTQCREGVAPDHVARALRCAGLFGIREEHLIVPLTRKFAKLLSFASEEQILMTIGGIGNFAKHRGQIIDELKLLLEKLDRKIAVGSISCDFRLTEVLHVLSKNNLLHRPTQDTIHNLLFGPARQFDELSLQDQVGTMRCYGILGLTFPKKELLIVSNTIRKASIHAPSSLYDSDIAAYVSATAMLKFDGSPQVIKELEGLFHEKLKGTSVSRARSRLLHEAIPAFAVLLKETSRQTEEIFQNPQPPSINSNKSSAFEGAIGDALHYQLKARFKHASHAGMFPADFIVRRPDGRLINLECDGGKYHLLYDVSSDALTTQYRGVDELRDRAVRKLGFLVARINTEEIRHPQQLPDLLRHKIRQAR